MAEIAGDQREQVARLLVRIAPNGVVAAGKVGLAHAFEIAIGEQDRRLGPIRLEPHPIGRKHVRPVEEIGNAPEALGLALRAIGRTGAIETHQLGVGGRIEAGLELELERALGRPRKQKLRRARLEIGVVEPRAVQRGGNEQEFVAVERQRGAVPASGIGPERQGRDDAGRMDVKRHIELDHVDEIVGRTVIGETNGLSDRCAHGGLSKSWMFLTIRPEASLRSRSA